jgi:polyhydroxyalkanoate synthesis regulator phasin
MGNTCSIEKEVGVQIADLVRTTANLVSTLEVQQIPVSAVPELLKHFVALERHAAGGRLLVTARAVDAQRWKREGYKFPAEWLAAQQGCTTGRAGEDLATSRRLEGLDDSTEAVKHGRLSPDQASAVTDAAAVNPTAEKDLLGQAENDSLKNLRDEAARRKAEVEDQERKRQRIHRERRARVWIGRDGAWNFQATGPIELGSRFQQQWQRFTNAHYQHTKALNPNNTHTHDNHAFDAFLALTQTPTPDTNPGTVAPVILVMMAIERLGAGVTAQTGLVGPVSTIAMGVLILDEPFTPWMMAGTVLVLAGVGLLAARR